MDKLFDKLGTYQIFANLLPGAFFCLASRHFLSVEMPVGNNVGEELLIFYFVGFFIGRIGSLLGKPLKRVGYKRDSYDNFLKAEKDDAKLVSMLDMSNFIRSMLACVMLTFIIFVAQKLPIDWTQLSGFLTWLAFPALVVLLLFAYRRQDWFIYKRISRKTDSNDVDKPDMNF